MENQDTSLGSVQRERKKEEVKLTFQKQIKGMLKHKVQRMENI
jgi:hypothetical protein